MSDARPLESREIPPLTRLSTGVAALDAAMDGGFPRQSVTVIAGEPGAGKTVLALQTMFAAARRDERCLYFTTLSEPSLKLARFMQRFDFFDPARFDEQIAIHDLGQSLRARDAEALLREIAAPIEEIEPALVVIDSFKAIHDLAADHRDRGRRFTYDLAVQMAAWGATTLLVGEYYDGEHLGSYPEFAIADGILTLRLTRQRLAQLRELEIRKLRGSAFRSGVHFFELGASGFEFYPRVRGPDDAPRPASSDAPARPARSSIGVPAIDELLRGGFPTGSATLVMGGAGTGKTLLGLHFLAEGARRGEPGLWLTLEETIDQLRSIAERFDFDFTTHLRAERLHARYVAPIEISTDRLLSRIRALVAETGARRLVLDSLTGLALGVADDRRFREFVYALAKSCRDEGVSLLMTMELTEVLGAAQLSGHGLSFAVDNMIQLRFLELGGRLERALSVLKARGVDLNTELRPFSIAAEGMRVGTAAQFHDLRGVLTGLPQQAEPPRGGPG